MREQGLKHRPFVSRDAVVWMDNDVDQSMALQDELDLLFPEIERVIVQDVKQRVVLRDRNRQLHKFLDEIWHHRTASASLRIEMPDVRYGRIVRKVECVVPFLITIE